jgi:hypothetical protein
MHGSWREDLLAAASRSRISGAMETAQRTTANVTIRAIALKLLHALLKH